MLTPNRKTKRSSGVYAAFKSPLKVVGENEMSTDASDVRSSKIPKNLSTDNSQTHPKSTERRVGRPQCEHDKEQQQEEKENISSCNVGNSTDVNKCDDDDSEIEKCIEELLSRRQNQSCINLDAELAQCRNRLHAYNEAKDSCIILFGLLANYRGCLVRELYQEFGMDLDD
ncbi:unnamed protein product [Trichobilharzia szidati]|nr:unnamed protein product [Trichobilharzia szidati]